MWLLLLVVGSCWLQGAFAHREDGGDYVALELHPRAHFEHSRSQTPSPQEPSALVVPDSTTQANASKPTSKTSQAAESSKKTPEKSEPGKPLICPCLQADDLPLPRDVAGNVLVPATFFGLTSDEVYRRNSSFGTFCEAHDKDLAPSCDAKQKHDKATSYCGRRWCFVADACACGEAAKKVNGKMALKDAWHIPMSRFKTDYFNAQEGQETNIWYSYANCGEGTDYIDDHMSSHDQSFCSGSTGHCEQEGEVCYRDAHGGTRYAGAQAKPGSTNLPWISIGLGFGAFVLMVLLGWLFEGLRGRPQAVANPAGEPFADSVLRPS